MSQKNDNRVDSFIWHLRVSNYVKLKFKPQISSIFHFYRVSDGRMAHILGGK